MQKESLRKQKGITLIALIITIIVMLILVGVTVTVALRGGVFSTTKQAKEETLNKRDEELKLAEGQVAIGVATYGSIDNYLQSIGVSEGIKVGATVNYIPDSGESGLEWQVLSIDEQSGEITLIAMTVNQELTLPDSGNGLDKLCDELYSKSINGEKVAKARSVTESDLNDEIRAIGEWYWLPSTHSTYKEGMTETTFSSKIYQYYITGSGAKSSVHIIDISYTNSVLSYYWENKSTRYVRPVVTTTIDFITKK